MISNEYIVGNYVQNKCLVIKGSQRKAMVTLIEDLNLFQEYKLETFYLAVSIADNYLKRLAISNQKAPCLALLGVTCLFIAAKIEQHVVPSSTNLINATHGAQFSSVDMHKLESLILYELDFDVRFVTPIDLLSRFLKLMCVANSQAQEDAPSIIE